MDGDSEIVYSEEKENTWWLGGVPKVVTLALDKYIHKEKSIIDKVDGKAVIEKLC